MGSVLTLIGVLVTLLCLMGPAYGQQIDATFDVGRVYSLVDGRYVHATAPGLTLTFGPFSVSNTLYLERASRPLEHDLVVAWERTCGPRVTLTANVGEYRYRARIHDWSWSAGLRWRIR